MTEPASVKYTEVSSDLFLGSNENYSDRDILSPQKLSILVEWFGDGPGFTKFGAELVNS